MGIGKRDYIIVHGMQGYGKSVWTQLYSRGKPRLFLYDPKAEYPDVDYMTPPDEIIPKIMIGEIKQFRYGSYMADDVEMLGKSAYGATDCALILEECKMLFHRGEDIVPWAVPIVMMGREPKLDLVLVSQRAMAIPPDIRSQASRIVTFLQTEIADCKALSQKFGGEWEDEIRNLPELECLDWQAGAGVRRYRIRP